jgi:NIMA (never in mitosis gene a)-related kinase
LETLGCGSFSTVFKARPRCGKSFDVVLKETRSLSASAITRANVLREMEMLKAARGCPYISHFHAAFQGNDNHYMILECISGGDLLKTVQQCMESKTPPDEATLWKYIFELGQGLIFLHRKGIVHRDVKCQNIMLTGSGHVKLIDLGLAASLQPGQELTERCGTPFYMAIEMINKDPYDHRVDVWSAGCVFYMLAQLRPAFNGTTLPQLCQSILNDTPPPLCSRRYSSNLSHLILGMLDKRRGCRPWMEDVLSHPVFGHYPNFPPTIFKQPFQTEEVALGLGSLDLTGDTGTLVELVARSLSGKERENGVLGLERADHGCVTGAGSVLSRFGAPTAAPSGDANDGAERRPGPHRPLIAREPMGEQQCSILTTEELMGDPPREDGGEDMLQALEPVLPVLALADSESEGFDFALPPLGDISAHQCRPGRGPHCEAGYRAASPSPASEPRLVRPQTSQTTYTRPARQLMQQGAPIPKEKVLVHQTSSLHAFGYSSSSPASAPPMGLVPGGHRTLLKSAFYSSKEVNKDWHPPSPHSYISPLAVSPPMLSPIHPDMIRISSPHVRNLLHNSSSNSTCSSGRNGSPSQKRTLIEIDDGGPSLPLSQQFNQGHSPRCPNNASRCPMPQSSECVDCSLSSNANYHAGHGSISSMVGEGVILEQGPEGLKKARLMTELTFERTHSSPGRLMENQFMLFPQGKEEKKKPLCARWGAEGRKTAQRERRQRIMEEHSELEERQEGLQPLHCAGALKEKVDIRSVLAPAKPIAVDVCLSNNSLASSPSTASIHPSSILFNPVSDGSGSTATGCEIKDDLVQERYSCSLSALPTSMSSKEISSHDVNSANSISHAQALAQQQISLNEFIPRKIWAVGTAGSLPGSRGRQRWEIRVSTSGELDGQDKGGYSKEGRKCHRRGMPITPSVSLR